jgi:hypothetical protein
MLLLVFCGCKNTNDFLTVQYFFNYFIDNQHYSRKKSFLRIVSSDNKTKKAHLMGFFYVFL